MPSVRHADGGRRSHSQHVACGQTSATDGHSPSGGVNNVASSGHGLIDDANGATWHARHASLHLEVGMGVGRPDAFASSTGAILTPPVAHDATSDWTKTCPRCGSAETRTLPMSRSADWARCVACGHAWTAAMLRIGAASPTSVESQSAVPGGRVTAVKRAAMPALFWSRRGEVACAAHAPADGSPRWTTEAWAPVSARRRRLTYQCEHCHDSPFVKKQRPLLR